MLNNDIIICFYCVIVQQSQDGYRYDFEVKIGRSEGEVSMNISFIK